MQVARTNNNKAKTIRPVKEKNNNTLAIVRLGVFSGIRRVAKLKEGILLRYSCQDAPRAVRHPYSVSTYRHPSLRTRFAGEAIFGQ